MQNVGKLNIVLNKLLYLYFGCANSSGNKSIMYTIKWIWNCTPTLKCIRDCLYDNIIYYYYCGDRHKSYYAAQLDLAIRDSNHNPNEFIMLSIILHAGLRTHYIPLSIALLRVYFRKKGTGKTFLLIDLI